MIRPLTDSIEPRWAAPPARTPGRYEGLVNFAHRLSGRFGSVLREWTLLDVGGADGWLGEIIVCARYWCADPWAEADALYRASLPGTVALRRVTTAVRAIGEALPLRTRSLDLVVSKQTLPHFTWPYIACREMLRVARQAVVIQQEFPDGPIGWPGHSRSRIDAPNDILEALTAPGWTASYDGMDFVARRQAP